MQSLLVFDEHVQGGGPFYTSQAYNDLLGQYDQLALHAVVDETDAPGKLTVHVQHAADGRSFVNKNATAEIAAATLHAGKANVLTGADAGSAPSLGFVRLAVSLSGAKRAHIKIHVTMRDQGTG